MPRFLASQTLFSTLLRIINKQKLFCFDQTSVLYILKYHTLLGNLNFRSLNFGNSACIGSAKNASISCVTNPISTLLRIIGRQKLFYFDQTSVLYILKYHTLLGKLIFRSSHF